jgi:hypothetical protein
VEWYVLGKFSSINYNISSAATNKHVLVSKDMAVNGYGRLFNIVPRYKFKYRNSAFISI